MENDSKKLNLNELEKISGGKVVELKDGKYMVVDDRATSYGTKEEAQKVETRGKMRTLYFPRTPQGIPSPRPILPIHRPIRRPENQEIKTPSAVPLKDKNTLPSSNPDTSKND